MLWTDYSKFKRDTAVHIPAAGLLQTTTNSLPFWSPQFRSATTVLYLDTHFRAQYTTRHFLHIIRLSKSPGLCEPNSYLAAPVTTCVFTALLLRIRLRKCDAVWLREWFLTSQRHIPEDINLEEPSCWAKSKILKPDFNLPLCRYICFLW
jgi:hypothetical protein